MDKKEFTRIRRYLGKTQNELAKLITVSPKAVQSYEQGWRNIPSHVERELLLLLSLKKDLNQNYEPCWQIKKCSEEWKKNCIVWELQARHFCWLLNGTLCEGKIQESWDEKIKMCRKCEVFHSMFD